MKTFLMIVAAIIVIAVLSIVYLYNSVTYQPDYFEQVETFNAQSADSEAAVVQDRLKQNLAERGKADLTGNDITLLMIDQVEKMKGVHIKPAIKKVKSEIRNGRLKIESIVDVTRLSENDMPPEAAEALAMLIENVPQDMLSDVYVAFEGIPVDSEGMLQLDQNSVISIGDFSQKLSEIQADKEFRINSSVLKQLGINRFKVMDDHIEISTK